MCDNQLLVKYQWTAGSVAIFGWGEKKCCHGHDMENVQRMSMSTSKTLKFTPDL